MRASRWSLTGYDDAPGSRCAAHGGSAPVPTPDEMAGPRRKDSDGSRGPRPLALLEREAVSDADQHIGAGLQRLGDRGAQPPRGGEQVAPSERSAERVPAEALPSWCSASQTVVVMPWVSAGRTVTSTPWTASLPGPHPGGGCRADRLRVDAVRDPEQHDHDSAAHHAAADHAPPAPSFPAPQLTRVPIPAGSSPSSPARGRCWPGPWTTATTAPWCAPTPSSAGTPAPG